MSIKSEVEAAGERVAQAEQAAVARIRALESRIEAWFTAHIHNSPAARDTAVFNHVRAAVDELKLQLSKEI